jgi:hypothetical protein
MSMLQHLGPTEDDPEPTAVRIRAAIEARIDRLIALEELSWELKAFVDDLWGPPPEAWSERVAELGLALGQSQPLATGEFYGAAWEVGRARILAGFTPEQRWLIGLSDHLWDHAFDSGREAIRRAAVESFLAATLTYIKQHPDVPPLSPPGLRADQH